MTDTKVLNPELPPERMDGKFPRLDIRCTLDDGSQVDAEMQNSMYQDDQIKRSIYYASVLVQNSLSSGQDYMLLPHVYQIMFMDFKVTEDDRLHHSYTFREDADYAQLSYERFVHDCKSREGYAYRRGEEQGLRQGEHNHAIQTAKRLLKMGLPPEQVAEGVGLPLSEIQAL